jgi:hypothetical protein
VASTTRAWLYVRGERSVRVVVEGGTLAVYGPGAAFRRHEFTDAAAAMLEHSTLEQELVGDGWSLEQMTTERRSGRERRGTVAVDRRRGLRLVGQPATDRD